MVVVQSFHSFAKESPLASLERIGQSLWPYGKGVAYESWINDPMLPVCNSDIGIQPYTLGTWWRSGVIRTAGIDFETSRRQLSGTVSEVIESYRLTRQSTAVRLFRYWNCWFDSLRSAGEPNDCRAFCAQPERSNAAGPCV
jgi:hypothetical protein